MAQRRAGKGVRHDIINVTEIDDDLEELSLSSGVTSNKSGSTINGHVKPKYSDPLASNSYKDPLKSINVKDPFLEKKDLNSIIRKKPESALNNDSVFAKKTTQNSSNVQSSLNKNGISTQSSSHMKSTSTVTSATSSVISSQGLGSSSTQLSRNQQFTSAQSSQRTNAPKRINKNQKGFSHEEKDLYIDDIEDF